MPLILQNLFPELQGLIIWCRKTTSFSTWYDDVAWIYWLWM